MLIFPSLLESKIQEARSKKDTLRARAQSAKFVLTSISGLMLLVVLNCWNSGTFCTRRSKGTRRCTFSMIVISKTWKQRYRL
ncbi:hypothetical protein Syun_020327 [Stephania yunnanensis]|uniref:Uncharacterized protein n=1 Tax=Stephania yunnanensis TaxID=152371 RepID=A0AAP0NPW9_9MAGN